MKKRTNHSAIVEMFRSAWPGLLVGVMIMLAGAVIIAVLVSGEKIGENHYGYGVLITLLIASFVSAFITIRNGTENKLLSAVSSAIGMVIFLLLGNIVIAGGQMDGAIQTFLLVAAGTVSAVLIKTDKKKRRKYRIEK